ncbi:Protein kinase-like domain containing protein [Tylopilus felleus]
MSPRIPRPQLVDRPLVDLTDQIIRDSPHPIDGGVFGDVYKCRYSDTSESSSLVAVKVPRYFASQDPEEARRRLEVKKDLRRELGLLRRLEHPNVITLLGVAEGFGPIQAIVLPWMSNGSLHAFLENKGETFTMDERLHLVLGIVSGLEYLHSIPVFHGDLHSGNVLIDDEYSPRISDFGLSCTVGRLQPGLSYLQRLSSTGNFGAVRWAAPERLSGYESRPSGDMYSFGCIMFEVLSGDIPWKEENDIQVAVLKVTRHRPPSRPIRTAVDDTQWALMIRCWATSPQRRPTASAVVGEVHLFCNTDTAKLAHAVGRGGRRPTCMFVIVFFLL